MAWDYRVKDNCDRPPIGWWCGRSYGHGGPCAARPRWWNLTWQWRIWRNR